MENNKIAVVAIGGNFLSDGNSTMEEQSKKAYRAAELVEILVKEDFKVIIVHGNGPQVGMTYLRQLSGNKNNIPPLNLALCNALTQAEIGTYLELAVINKLNNTNRDINVITLVSQVEVKADDPAFQNPTKPIGPFYDEETIKEIKKDFPDWTIIEDSGRGYRRVVPSPIPLNVFAAKSIKDVFKTAQVVIAGGGGGIPVVRGEDNSFKPIDSVIDKDRTAFLIAKEVKASHFFLLTGVPHVSINFGKENQQELHKVSVDKMKQYLTEGQFPPGSMGPKIEAAIDFTTSTGGNSIITDADYIKDALEGKEGTIIHK